MPKHPRSPCSDCPYRKDSELKKWHPSEFEGVLRSEEMPLGSVFACHKHAALPEQERGMCAGWLLDQKKRGLPSIALRLMLMNQPEAVEALKKVKRKGLELFESVEEMCEANGVTKNALH